MAAPASPRLRVTASPEGEILPPAPPARGPPGAGGRASPEWEFRPRPPPARPGPRAGAAAPDPFVSRVLADARLTLVDVRSARPRRGFPVPHGILPPANDAA